MDTSEIKIACLQIAFQTTDNADEAIRVAAKLFNFVAFYSPTTVTLPTFSVGSISTNDSSLNLTATH